MLRHGTALRVPEELRDQRRARLKRLLDIKAPDMVIATECELFLRCYKKSWKRTWHEWKFVHFPNWLMWLTDSEWRKMTKEYAEFFEQVWKDDAGRG